MEEKQLVREIKAAALARMEDAARTVEDFENVLEQWNHLDENRERKERYWEMQREEETLELGYSDGMIFPIPFLHPAWREAVKGDFIAMIYDSAEEMWQIVEDWDVAVQLKALTAKQKEVLFLSAVRGCTPQQIACYQDKTDRAIRKLLAVALEYIRSRLAPLIREQIEAKVPEMTLEKRQFLEWYGQQKIALDKSKGD